MSAKFRDPDYLTHIQKAIGKINQYLSHQKEAEFARNGLVQDAVIRNLEIIGEAITRLSAELKIQHAHLSWEKISRMHNRLIHGYVEVDLEIVWDTAKNLLPSFSTEITKIQQTLIDPAATAQH